MKNGDPKNRDSSASTEDTTFHQLEKQQGSKSPPYRILEQENNGGHTYQEETMDKLLTAARTFHQYNPPLDATFLHPTHWNGHTYTNYTPQLTRPWHHLHFYFDSHSHLLYMSPSLWSTLTSSFSCHHPTQRQIQRIEWGGVHTEWTVRTGFLGVIPPGKFLKSRLCMCIWNDLEAKSVIILLLQHWGIACKMSSGARCS